MKAHKNQLLVEGANDFHVISALMEYFKVAETFEVKDCGSVEKLISRFSLYLNQEASRIEKIAVVLDADENIQSRWQSLKNLISATGNYNIPDSLPAEGFVLEANSENAPRLGVWIMLNNSIPGMLEDFVAMLADKDDTLMTEAENELVNLKKA